MAAAGAASYMDCVGIHYNEGILPPTATSGDPRGNSGHYTRYFPTMVNLYASVFPNKPLCFTEIGYLTPPVGLNLFLSSLRFGKPIFTIMRSVLVFIGLELIALAVITYYSDLSLWLVRALGTQ